MSRVSQPIRGRVGIGTQDYFALSSRFHPRNEKGNQPSMSTYIIHQDTPLVLTGKLRLREVKQLA